MENEKFSLRNFLHVILSNNDVSTLVPVYLQLLDTDLTWFNEQPQKLYNDIIQVLLDNYATILQQAPKKSNKFERINGENLILVYNIKENLQIQSTSLVYNGTLSNPEVLRVAGFKLDPMWVFRRDPDNPYAPLPIDISTSNMQITDYFHHVSK